MTLSSTTPISLQLVPFHGATLEAVKVDETVWVSVRRMCEALGLDAEGQRQKLSNPDRAPWAVTFVTKVHDASGRNQDAFCIDLESVPMWLATIDTSRVTEEVRPKIVLYQREAAKALRDWFFGAKPMTRTEALRIALEASERADQLEAENRALLAANETLDAQAAFARDVEETTNTVTITRSYSF